ncbi:MAG: hypothetical protein NTX82_02485 [Candidatus Parcubacteria bacterium]|nr:hypothetical protein [Candidatus Parcubacteria bacterium]
MGNVFGIWIRTPVPDHMTYGLEIYLPGCPEKVSKFEELCLTTFMRTFGRQSQLGTFFQGGQTDKNWKYFEFLSAGPGCSREIQDMIFNLALDIAEQLGLELDIH